MKRVERKKPVVKIFVEGGIVQSVVATDYHGEVKVFDYDVEGCDSNRIVKDEAGDDCFISEYTF